MHFRPATATLVSVVGIYTLPNAILHHPRNVWSSGIARTLQQEIEPEKR